jgi:hypothetical protein
VTDPADLHLHTRHSDGMHPPASVVRMAARAGLTTLAITDHDTVSGLPEAQAAAETLGLRLIPGVEIGVEEGGVDVHVLAYGIDPAHPALEALLAALRRGREQRLLRILRRLRRLGLPLGAAEVRRHATRTGPVGRPHVAAALAERGWVATTEDAFRHLIGTDAPAYLCNHTPPVEEVLRTVLAAGGVPVLAHPVLYRHETFLERFRRAGLMGLEVNHPRHDAAAAARVRAMAEAGGLLQTGGSDYHGLLPSEPPVGSHRPPAGSLARLEEARCRVPEVLRRCHGVRV